jgi:predicted nuclease of restriction endonuclease-like RecB superfamily
MLTSDLLRARVVKSELRPQFVDPRSERIRERAADLLEIYSRGLAGGWPRERIDEEVGDLIGDGVDHLLTRGLAKILTDRCEFETESPVEPKELRARLFQQVAAAPSRGAAEAAYAALAEELGLSSEKLKGLLFADRKEEQRITGVDVPSGDWLVARYNVGLVQALLVRAVEVRLVLKGPSPERARQLFRYIKFHGLMYRIRVEGDVYEVTLDGPASLLRLNTRYGLALSKWFPALLLQDCPWELEATVLWTKRQLRKSLFLSSEQGLVSHYHDTGAYMTRIEEYFQERFLALDSGWALSREGHPLDLGGESVVIPDFTFRRGTHVAHLEIVGIWRKEWLMRRLGLLKAHSPGNLVLAVSSNLAGSKEALKDFPGEVITFKEIVPARKVLDAIARCAIKPKGGEKPAKPLRKTPRAAPGTPKRAAKK